MPSITIHGYKNGATVSAPLPDVWVYWKSGGKTTTLHADPSGLLMAADLTESDAEPHPSADMPWVYTAAFDVAKGASADVAFTRGAKPLPPALLPADRFTKVVVGDPWKAPFHAPANTWAEEHWIQIGAPNAIGWLFTLDILVPDHESALTAPAELDLLPMLFEFIGERPNSRTYFTDGLPQGASLLTWVDADVDHGDLVASALAGDSAPPPDPDLRPYERALRITGSVESRAAAVRIELITAAGKVAPQEYGTAVVVEPANGSKKPFHADLYFENAADAFGEVQIAIHAEGMADPYTDAYFVLLSGLQTALVDDWTANHSGKEPGPVPTEADDLRVVDFTSSPQPTVNQIFARARMQRLVEYKIDRDYRPYSAKDSTIVDTPQMPLWMAELQLVGAGESALRRLLRFRQKLRKSNPKQLEFQCVWGLKLWWNGPCADSGAGLSPERNYSYSREDWPNHEQRFVLEIDDKGEWKGLEKAGTLKGALTPDPGLIPFPVGGRRTAKAWVKQQQRRWGRAAGAPLRDTVVLEWQPRITDAGGKELIRGGNGRLELLELAVDAKGVAVGRDWNEPADETEEAPSRPVVRLAPFRIAGVNPAGPVEEMDTIVEAAVREYYNAHSTEAQVQALSLATWTVTLRKLIKHESKGVHFGVLGMDVVSNFGVAPYYGKQRGMPLFGPPHGYGIGQLDNPAVTDDACWSFVGNVKGAVALVMGAKASQALALFGAGTTDKWRAMFRRECVRRYNGWAPEFKLHNGVWKIDPGVPQSARPMSNGKPDTRVYYPNSVLGTTTQYYSGSGSQASDYDWPINFTEADWGPME